jgi:hypothetical protein
MHDDPLAAAWDSNRGDLDESGGDDEVGDDRGPHRRVLFEKGAVDLVHGREVALVLQIDIDRRRVLQRRSGRLEGAIHILEAPFRLCSDIAALLRHRSRHVDEAVGFHRGTERQIRS